MADEISSLTDFFVSVGFKVDKDSQRKAVQAHATTQKQLGTADKKGCAERLKAEAEEWMKRRELQKKARREQADARDVYLSKWKTGLVGTAATAASVAAGVTAITTGIVLAVDKAAKGLERLGYLSARAKSSPSKVTAFGYAASQTGSSQETGDAFLEQFGQRLNYPGYRQALQRQIGNIYGPDGKLLDSATLATRLGRKLASIRSKQGMVAAQAQGAVFGADDVPFLNSIMDPRFGGYESSREAQQATVGVDQNKAAQDAAAFEQSFRHLQAVIEDVATKIAAKLAQDIGPQLDKFATFLAAHSDAITNFVTKLADGVTKITTALAGSEALQATIKGLADSFSTMQEAIGSDDFKRNIRDFVESVKQLATQFKGFLQRLGILPTDRGSSDTGDGVDPVRKLFGGGGGDGRSPRAGGGPGSGSASTGRAHISAKANPEVVSYIREAFAREGIDPNTALKVAASEGLNVFDPNKPDPGGDQGTSFGPWQMHYGGSGIPGQNSPGLGDRFDKENPGISARDPKNWRLVTDWVAKYVRKHGWGDWHGRIPAGVGIWDGVGTYSPSAPPASGESSYRQMMKAAQKAAGRGESYTNPDGSSTMKNFNPATGMVAPPPGQTAANSTVNRGDVNITHNPTFNISGPDLAAAMSAARISASRGNQDLLRRAQGAVQ